MGKRLFLLLIAGIIGGAIGVIGSPEILMATDTVEVAGLATTGVETVVLPEPEPEPVMPAAPAAGLAYAVTVPQVANYTVTGYSGGIMVDPVGIIRTGDLIYGHNSWDLMGSLEQRYVGEVFTITEGGVTRSYRVAAVVKYAKTSDEVYDYLDGDKYLMGDIVYGAMGYSVALMTCTGEMIGGGDATHRLVVYADAI